MRKPVPGNKQVFIRFHKDIIQMIEEYAAKQNMAKATVVSKIFEQYVKEPFYLSSLSAPYFIKRGRSSEKVVGKGMIVTVKKVVDNAIKIEAGKEGMRENDFRTAIVFSFLKKEREKEEQKEEDCN